MVVEDYSSSTQELKGEGSDTDEGRAELQNEPEASLDYEILSQKRGKKRNREAMRHTE